MTHEKTQALVIASREVLAQYSDRITLRQLYYRLVAAGIIENRQREYKRLGTVMTTARKSREIPVEAFCDLTRESKDPYGWGTLADYLITARKAYKRLRWQAQPAYVEVWVEKQALATIFAPICEDWQARLVICRGYPSVSCVYEAAERFKEAEEAKEGPLVLLYFGDWDPSGVDISRNVAEELTFWGASVKIQRVALNPPQIKEHHLPPAPAKESDTRTPRFIADHGEDTVELDALPPDVLASLIEAAIQDYIDAATWSEEAATEAGEQQRLSAAFDDLLGESLD